MEMVRMSSNLRLIKDFELSQTAYLKFHSVMISIKYLILMIIS